VTDDTSHILISTTRRALDRLKSLRTASVFLDSVLLLLHPARLAVLLHSYSCYALPLLVVLFTGRLIL
jgi:hypothetical protein